MIKRRIAVVGSRTLGGATVRNAIIGLLKQHSRFPEIVVISGGATGVDTEAEYAAFELGLEFKLFRAKWDVHGKSAGPRRNGEMAHDADEVIAIHPEQIGVGTADMIRQTRALGKPVRVVKMLTVKHAPNVH